MAGKAPLLLAMVLFIVGAAGLALTSARQAEWGPFQPHSRTPQMPKPVAVRGSSAAPDVPPALTDLLSNVPDIQPTAAPGRMVSAASTPEATDEPEPPAPTPTPIPPIRVHGISADDAGASAASLSPTPPPPIFIGGISFDDGEVEDQGSGEPGTGQTGD